MTEEIQRVYSKYMNLKETPKEYDVESTKRLSEVACRYGFVDNTYQLYSTVKDFTADEYMALLRTYPNHMEVKDEDRNLLFKGIHDVINHYGGIITVYYTMDLELARRPY